MNPSAMGKFLQEAVDADGNKLYDRGLVVPSDATAGYAIGCIFVHTDGNSVDTILYVNIGSGTSCDFDPVSGE